MERIRFTLDSARTMFEAYLCVNGCDGANAQATFNAEKAVMMLSSSADNQQAINAISAPRIHIIAQPIKCSVSPCWRSHFRPASTLESSSATVSQKLAPWCGSFKWATSWATT